MKTETGAVAVITCIIDLAIPIPDGQDITPTHQEGECLYDLVGAGRTGPGGELRANYRLRGYVPAPVDKPARERRERGGRRRKRGGRGRGGRS